MMQMKSDLADIVLMLIQIFATVFISTFFPHILFLNAIIRYKTIILLFHIATWSILGYMNILWKKIQQQNLFLGILPCLRSKILDITNLS